MPLKESPVWLEGVTFPTADPAAALPDRADVAVIGGGFTGLAAARALVRPDFQPGQHHAAVA